MAKKEIKILICENCKRFWVAPKERCECGSTTLTETHPSNQKYAENEMIKTGDANAMLDEYASRLKEVLETTGQLDETDLELCKEYTTLDKITETISTAEARGLCAFAAEMRRNNPLMPDQEIYKAWEADVNS